MLLSASNIFSSRDSHTLVFRWSRCTGQLVLPLFVNNQSKKLLSRFSLRLPMCESKVWSWARCARYERRTCPQDGKPTMRSFGLSVHKQPRHPKLLGAFECFFCRLSPVSFLTDGCCYISSDWAESVAHISWTALHNPPVDHMTGWCLIAFFKPAPHSAMALDHISKPAHPPPPSLGDGGSPASSLGDGARSDTRSRTRWCRLITCLESGPYGRKQHDNKQEARHTKRTTAKGRKVTIKKQEQSSRKQTAKKHSKIWSELSWRQPAKNKSNGTQ